MCGLAIEVPEIVRLRVETWIPDASKRPVHELVPEVAVVQVIPVWTDVMFWPGAAMSGLSRRGDPKMRLGPRELKLATVSAPGSSVTFSAAMFAFMVFWTYTSFSQYLIIWSGNIAEETPWYLHRTGHGWQYVAISLVALGWFLPFLLLMQRKIKRQAHLLVGVAVIVIVARHFDLYWQIGPAFHHDGFHGPHWMDLAMPFAIGGFWLALFSWLLKARPITNNQVEMIHAEAHAAHH